MRFAAVLALLLAAAPLGFAQDAGTQDIQLRQLRNDAADGGEVQLAVQVRTARRGPNTTLGSATVDIRYDEAHLVPISAGGIPTAAGYSTVLRIIECPVGDGMCIRLTLFSDGLDAANPGVSIGRDFATLGTVTFRLDATSAAGTTFEIAQPTLSVGYYDSPDDASGSGRIEDNTGAVGEVVPFTTVTNLTTRPPAFVVTNPVANDYFAWGDPINVRWMTEPSTPAGEVRVALLCEGRDPYTINASRVNDGATGFLMSPAVGVHGGPADTRGGCRAEVALASDPGYAAASPSFAVQDSAKAVAVTEPTRLDRYGLQGRFHWRWDPADIQTTGTVRLSLLCEGRGEFVRFPATPNDGNQGYELLADFGAYDNCHAQVAATDDLTNYGRGMSFEILDEPLPGIEIVAPTAGTVWTAGTTRTITWNTVSTDPDVNVFVFLDNFTPGASPFVTRLAITPNDGAFTWAIPSDQAPGADYRIRLAAYAQDGSLIRALVTPVEIAAPTARTTAPLAGWPLERGWTRVTAPQATDARAWLAPLAAAAGRVVARDAAGRLLAVTAEGATGTLGALAAGTALDVWVDGDAVLGEPPPPTRRAELLATRFPLPAGTLDAPAALWTVTAPGLADGDEVAVFRGDRLVGHGTVRGGSAETVVLTEPFEDTPMPPLAAPTAVNAARLAVPSAETLAAETLAAETLAAETLAADASPEPAEARLRLVAWAGGAVRALEPTHIDGRPGGESLPLAAGASLAVIARLPGEAASASPPSDAIHEASAPTEPPPAELTLAAARPNPARRTTTLRVGLPEAGALSVEVFDVRGRRVAVLAAGGERAAGWHAFPLDASRLAPGLYVVRLATTDAVRTRTLTVVR